MLVSVVTMTTELGDITSVFAGVFAAKMPEDCLQVTFLFSDTRCGAGLMRQWVKCQAPPRVPRKPRLRQPCHLTIFWAYWLLPNCNIFILMCTLCFPVEQNSILLIQRHRRQWSNKEHIFRRSATAVSPLLASTHVIDHPDPMKRIQYCDLKINDVSETRKKKEKNYASTSLFTRFMQRRHITSIESTNFCEKLTSLYFCFSIK